MLYGDDDAWVNRAYPQRSSQPKKEQPHPGHTGKCLAIFDDVELHVKALESTPVTR